MLQYLISIGKKIYVTIMVCNNFSEEEKCILIKATGPKNIDIADVAQVNILTCHIQYFDVVECLPRQSVVAALVIQDKACTQPVLAASNDKVQLQLLRVQAAETIDQANEIAKEGNLHMARDLLNACIVRIDGSRVRLHPLAQHITQTMRDSISGLANKMAYLQIGRAQMTNHSHSHWQQRSNTGSSSAEYLTKPVKPPQQFLVPPSAAAAMGVLRNTTVAAGSSSEAGVTKMTSPYRISSKCAMMNKYTSSKQ